MLCQAMSMGACKFINNSISDDSVSERGDTAQHTVCFWLIDSIKIIPDAIVRFHMRLSSQHSTIAESSMSRLTE